MNNSIKITLMTTLIILEKNLFYFILFLIHKFINNETKKVI